MLDLCYERASPDPETSPHSLQAQQQRIFEEELTDFAYFIPPNFPDSIGSKVIFHFYQTNFLFNDIKKKKKVTRK